MSEVPVQNKVLMKKDAWELLSCEIGRSAWINSLLHSYIAHTCPDAPTYPGLEKRGPCWWNLSIIDRACDKCGEYPPEDMMGLWKLHNFDYIQAGG